ncbi:ATP-binding cassette domain-containing protein [Streptomyces tricolor]|nr:ATP-binding cassette domain-containing protein [Streptomyces tricolor]
MAGRIQDFAADVARLKDVENSRPTRCTPGPAGADSTRRLHGRRAGEHHLRLRPLDQPLLTGFDLTVGPGQQVALVGGSNGCKSTVSRLISGLYTPWDGVIRIDGRRLEDIPRGALAASRLLRRPGRVPLRGLGPRQRRPVGPVDPRRGRWWRR